MVSPKDIKVKAEKWWNDGTFLSSILSGDQFFPKEVPKIKLVDVSKVHEEYQTIIKEQEALKSNSKEVKGYGYTLEWEEKNYQKIGKNKFVKRIQFESDQDFLKYIGKEKDYSRFNENHTFIKETIPELEAWIVANPLKVVDYGTVWHDLLKVCNYFLHEHTAGKYYIRELPIKVHTKFIESHKTILISLLDHLIPEKVNHSAKNDFCLRYGLRDKETQVRIRILCDEIKLTLPFADFSIPLSDFKKMELSASRVFITENLMNFLTLPVVTDSVAIWSGGGFNISYLAETAWLKSRQIYYWGDIDVAGYHILSQLRSYYPNSKSIMMDKGTFDKYFEGGEGKPIPANELRGLNEEELSLYSFIRLKNLRLEQEKIPQEYVTKQIESIS